MADPVEVKVGNVPPNNQLTVLSADSVRYNYNIYKGVTEITQLDGTVKTCAELLKAAGGESYRDDELKKCVRIEGYDPSPTDPNITKDRAIFTVYSNNSRQTSKNQTGSVPGNLWIEMFDFTGTAADNAILKMWADAGVTGFKPYWRGFKLNWGTTGKRSYVLTHLDDFNEESLPCPPVTIDTTYMHVVRIQGVFAATNNRVPIKAFRLYRTTVGTDNTFVYREVPIHPIGIPYGLNQPPPENPPHNRFPHSIYVAYPAPNPFAYAPFGFNYDDDVLDKDMTQITLESAEWDPPPLPCRGLTAGWNGMLFAHWENTLFPFEPYRPFTAPGKYRIAFPHKINATIVDGNSLIVLTTGPAYMVTGAHPSQLMYEALQHTQASKESDPINGRRPPSRSVAKTPFGIAYVSDEGISIEAGGRSQNMTDKHFDKITWQRRFRPSFGRLRLAYSNEKVLMFTKDDPGSSSLMISNENGQMSALAGYAVRNTFALPGSDGLYIITGQGNQQSTLWKFEDYLSPRIATRWKSKRFIFPKPESFGCFQIAGTGTVGVQIFADGLPVFATSVALAGSRIVRLPTGVRARRWEFQLDVAVNGEVVEFYLANTPLELQSA